ncbi:hypothetical protein E1B28_008113 [Marasmius oreades]|uniref:phytol kinase n=1 Tax=Marasmius oreades TaxID=181124 RepID=A0A9P7URF4_9AGAR|nr:uncharacterized protein E1B28_008113 [Marasmius oreades]KAG7091712.1 hypothetical protein E1B28_008113 [Marasmius oreades]
MSGRRLEKMISQIEAHRDAGQVKARAALAQFNHMSVTQICDSFMGIKLPSSIKPKSLHSPILDQPSNRVLNALAAFGTSFVKGQIPAEHARSLWPKVFAWAALFIRDIVLVQLNDNDASVPADLPPVQMKEKVIWVLCSVFWVGTSSNSLSDRSTLYELAFKSIPTFVPLALELCVYLAATDHLASYAMWEQVRLLSSMNSTGEKQLDASCKQLLLPGSRYDIATISMHTLDNRLEKPFDPYTVRESLSLIQRMLSERIQQEVGGDNPQHLRWQGLICKIIRILSRSTSFLSEEWRATHRDEIMAIVECMGLGTNLLQLLLHAGKGPSWASKALDEKLLVVIAKLPATFSSEKGRLGLTLGEFYSMLLSTLRPFTLYRPVLRRVFRNLTLINSSRSLQYRSGSENSMLNAILAFEQKARSTKLDMENFDNYRIKTGKMSCSNANCTSLSNEAKFLKRCSQCHVAMYCSRECQKEDWSQKHRTECRNFTTLKDGYGYHVSHLDELFVRNLVNTMIRDDYLNNPEKFQPGSSRGKDLVSFYMLDEDPPRYGIEIIEHAEKYIKMILPPEGYGQFLKLNQKPRNKTDILVLVILPGSSSLFYIHSLL